jgi:hypothetical protein
MTKAKVKRMPGKERPAASRLVIQRLPRRNFTIGISAETRNPPQANRRGSRLPIPSEPAPCHRPWITSKGATPAKPVQHYHAIKGSEHQRATACLANLHVGKVKQSRLRPLSLWPLLTRSRMAGFNLITEAYNASFEGRTMRVKKIAGNWEAGEV